MSGVVFAGGGTGGHLYPALALAEAVQAERPGTRVHFVGARRGVEARVLPELGLPHTLLPFQPFHRERVWRNWRLPLSLASGTRGLASLFLRFRPDLVVGTGGYASGPACLFAIAAAIPVAVQEQNSFPGVTTQLLARWARQVHLGFPEAKRQLKPGRDTRVFALGNPIRPPDPALDREVSRARFGLSARAVVVLVTGGSQGSQAINDVLLGALDRVAAEKLPARPAGLEILWATGPAHIASAERRLAPLGASAWVHATGYITDMPMALAATDIALSRAGAMATAELVAWSIPALLVPLPTAAADHQTHNARTLAGAGAAVFIAQAELTPERLWTELVALAGDTDRRARMASAARTRAHPDAARDIARELVRLVPHDSLGETA